VKPLEPLIEKKPYESPRLTVHGEIHQITQNAAKKGRFDAFPNKT
jgi:hypothetical protein